MYEFVDTSYCNDGKQNSTVNIFYHKYKFEAPLFQNLIIVQIYLTIIDQCSWYVGV